MKLYQVLAELKPDDTRLFRLVADHKYCEGEFGVWYKLVSNSDGLWIAYKGCSTYVKDTTWLTVSMLLCEEWEMSPPGYKPTADEV